MVWSKHEAAWETNNLENVWSTLIVKNEFFSLPWKSTERIEESFDEISIVFESIFVFFINSHVFKVVPRQLGYF